jgi:S-methylmethionine-dependent homocysteine/selenocysteine methylase
VLNPTASAPVSLSHVFQLGDLDKPVVYSHQRMSALIERSMDLTLLSTLPLITALKVSLPLQQCCDVSQND